MSRDDLLIQPSQVAVEDPVILDVRWQLSDQPGAGESRFEQGHAPGAVFVDLEMVLTQHTDDPRDGRHPLPDPARLAVNLAALGVTRERPIVIMDDAGSFAAERAWWVLAWVGLPSRIVDGGIAAWQAAGLPLETGPSRPIPAPPLELRPGSKPTVTADGAASAGSDPSSILIDARAAGRFRGETEPLDPKAGHIPGAINVPVSGLFADGRLPAEAEIRSAFGDLATDDVTAYCGSGCRRRGWCSR